MASSTISFDTCAIPEFIEQKRAFCFKFSTEEFTNLVGHLLEIFERIALGRKSMTDIDIKLTTELELKLVALSELIAKLFSQ